MDHDLPAEGAIDAVDHELTAGFDHRIDVVGAGVAGFVDRRDHRGLGLRFPHDGSLWTDFHNTLKILVFYVTSVHRNAC
jgi:hypothetical protein